MYEMGRVNYPAVKELFKQIVIIYPLFTHSKIWKLFMDLALQKGFEEAFEVINLWMLYAPPTPSTTLYFVEKIKQNQQYFDQRKLEVLLKGIIEK